MNSELFKILKTQEKVKNNGFDSLEPSKERAICDESVRYRSVAIKCLTFSGVMSPE